MPPGRPKLYLLASPLAFGIWTSTVSSALRLSPRMYGVTLDWKRTGQYEKRVLLMGLLHEFSSALYNIIPVQLNRAACCLLLCGLHGVSACAVAVQYRPLLPTRCCHMMQPLVSLLSV